MRKIITIIATSVIALIALLVPNLAFANFAATWQGTSTTQNWITPVKVNGNEQTVVGNNFIATSTTASSTFKGATFTQINTTATSTTKGFNVTSGCFAINNVCLTSGGGASLSGGSPNTLTYWTSGTAVGATSSPTVGYITATSTATSTFAGFININGSNSTSTFIGNLKASTSTFANLTVTGLATSTFNGTVKNNGTVTNNNGVENYGTYNLYVPTNTFNFGFRDIDNSNATLIDMLNNANTGAMNIYDPGTGQAASYRPNGIVNGHTGTEWITFGLDDSPQIIGGITGVCGGTQVTQITIVGGVVTDCQGF